ncbi:MAG: type II CAAX endopeptidase family protein [Candidatus Cybelea sp.]
MRLLLIFLLFGALLAPVVLAAHPPVGTWRSVAMMWFTALLLLAVLVAVERLAAGRRPAAIGLDPRHALRDLALGGLFGAILFSLVVLELALGRFYRIVATHATWGIAIAALFFLADALFEELLFRGVIFRLIQEWTGTWIALAVSAAIFGFAHAANPGATWVSSLAIALEAGVLLGAAFVVTGNLWFPIGLHFAWNFFEGPIYGTQVSGAVLHTSALAAHLAGPRILTGGPFGPEAGLAAIVTCLAAAIVLLAIAVRRRLIVAPAWLRSATLPRAS